MWINWSPDINEDSKTLQAAIEKMPDRVRRTSFLVWLLENPKSSLALPGLTNSQTHQYMHILLGKNLFLGGESFVMGFCMGNSLEVKIWHVYLFKFFAMFFYPRLYRLNRHHLVKFDEGFKYGKNLFIKDINLVDFKKYLNWKIRLIRNRFGIKKEELLKLS